MQVTLQGFSVMAVVFLLDTPRCPTPSRHTPLGCHSLHRIDTGLGTVLRFPIFKRIYIRATKANKELSKKLRSLGPPRVLLGLVPVWKVMGLA